jgi:hypothetical protein
MNKLIKSANSSTSWHTMGIDFTSVVKEEGFQGILGWLQGIFIPSKLYNVHNIFLAELKKKSEAQVS